MTYASTSRLRSQRASQNPSRPASNATTSRVIAWPAAIASSRQRCNSASRASSSGASFFQRFSLDTRNHSAYQPSCGTEFDNRYQCLILLKGDEGPAEVIFRLRHGATPSSGCSDDGATPRRPPHSIYSRFSGIWPTASLPINHLLCENRRTQGRMGEVGLVCGHDRQSMPMTLEPIADIPVFEVGLLPSADLCRQNLPRVHKLIDEALSRRSHLLLPL